MKFVNIGKVPGIGGEDTYSPNCKILLVKRKGYEIERNLISGNRCPKCQAPDKVPQQSDPLLGIVSQEFEIEAMQGEKADILIQLGKQSCFNFCFQGFINCAHNSLNHIFFQGCNLMNPNNRRYFQS